MAGMASIQDGPHAEGLLPVGSIRVWDLATFQLLGRSLRLSQPVQTVEPPGGSFSPSPWHWGFSLKKGVPGFLEEFFFAFSPAPGNCQRQWPP